ncbi:hypothetical protein [Lacihabitans soyangensis]|uniref:Uncharacterized protein n=1 Tax=Lacihabitans soyangensis TaxID=869394 RepID=A0AAE3H615_9BACT|nr:hypothetical protein [Lacihabitans soyangensis]MCP9765117.1 hypothetical protein [Lacihabitans soyangensis]
MIEFLCFVVGLIFALVGAMYLTVNFPMFVSPSQAVGFPKFKNPPLPPPMRKEPEKKEAYSFLQVCSYKQLKVLSELFPPEQKMPKDTGDLGVFLVAVLRQLDLVEGHIRDYKNEAGTDADG